MNVTSSVYLVNYLPAFPPVYLSLYHLLIFNYLPVCLPFCLLTYPTYIPTYPSIVQSALLYSSHLLIYIYLPTFLPSYRLIYHPIYSYYLPTFPYDHLFPSQSVSLSGHLQAYLRISNIHRNRSLVIVPLSYTLMHLPTIYSSACISICQELFPSVCVILRTWKEISVVKVNATRNLATCQP